MEVIVGAFMVMVLLGLGYFTIILSREAIFKEHYELEVVFSHVMGLREGDNVVTRGMPVGTIKSLDLQGDGVHIVTSLNEELEIRDGYRVTIVATSVLGGRHLEIDAGPDEAPVVAARPLDGVEPYDLMADAAEVINAIKDGLITGGVLDNLQKAASDLQSMIARVHDGKGTLGRLFSDDDRLYEDLAASVASLRDVAARLEKGEGTLGKLLAGDGKLHDDLSAGVANLREVSDRLAAGKGTLGRLLAEDDTLYEDLAGTAASLKNMAARIERGEGMLGKLVTDESLYREVESVVGEARAAVDDYRETSPVVTFSSIFFGAF
jgi:phospholipid/cholesterol/gamma-HCH transport system substrate-binding protein